MKLLYAPLLFILYLLPVVLFEDPIDKVAELVRKGNIHELSTLFAPDVEITILNDGNLYARAQAELVVDKFFNSNKPRSVQLLHKVNSNPNYRFGVLIFTSDRGTYRMTYTLKDTGGNFLLIELRIETVKVK